MTCQITVYATAASMRACELLQDLKTEGRTTWRNYDQQ